jgi:citrate synthase
MDQSALPAPYLLKGLRRLVDDIRLCEVQEANGASDYVVGRSELLSLSECAVSYCGEPIEELLEHPSFERTTWLLLTRSLPTDDQLADFCSVVADSAVVDQTTTEIMTRLPLGARPLDLFPLCISLLKFFDPTPQDSSPDAARSRVWRLLAQLPLVLSGALGETERQSTNSPVESLSDETELSWAGRFLRRIRSSSTRPSAAEDAAMNTLMICECLTEMRPACFAARFAASTTNNIIAALESAATVFVAQLRNDPFSWTSDLLMNFRDPAQTEAWWRRREGQPMPFGFSAAVPDRRARHLSDSCQSLLGSADRVRVEACASRLEKLQAAEDRRPTTDWAAARLMALLDIPADRQSIVIAMARLVGWAAQALEQQSSGVSLFPSLRYGSSTPPTEQ